MREDIDEEGAIKMAAKVKQLNKLSGGLTDLQAILKSEDGVRKRARLAFAKVTELSDECRSPIRIGGEAMTKRVSKLLNGTSGIMSALDSDDLSISEAKAELRGLTREVGTLIELASEEKDRVKGQLKAFESAIPKAKEEAAPQRAKLAQPQTTLRSLAELEKLIQPTEEAAPEPVQEDAEEETASDEVHPARQILSKYGREERQMKAVKLSDEPGHNFTFLYLPLVVVLEHPLPERVLDNSRFKIIPLSGVRDKTGRVMTPYVNQNSREDYNTTYVFENQLVLFVHKSVPDGARKRETLTKRFENDDAQSLKKRKLRGQDERVTRQDIIKMIEHSTKSRSLVDVLSGADDEDGLGLYSTNEMKTHWLMPSAQISAMSISSILGLSFPWVQARRILPDHTKKSKTAATKSLQKRSKRLAGEREEFEDFFANHPENVKLTEQIDKAESEVETLTTSIEKLEKAIDDINRNIKICNDRMGHLQGKEKSKNIQQVNDFEIGLKDRKAKREAKIEERKQLKGDILQYRAKRRTLHDKLRDEFREESNAAGNND